MRHQMAITKNIKRFIGAVRRLQARPMGIEGMGLLWGEPGEGKTTSVAYVANQTDGIFIRAKSVWSTTAMLQALAVELGLPRQRARSAMVDAAIQKLVQNPRPIFVDEGDYIVNKREMLDSLRDIYDETGAPVILIGMEAMAAKIQVSGRFARRITEWIKFRGIDESDAQVVLNTVCEIGIEPDLMRHIWTQSGANIGRLIIGLQRVEAFGRMNGFDGPGGGNPVTLKAWGDNQLFYDQPQFGGRVRRS